MLLFAILLAALIALILARGGEYSRFHLYFQKGNEMGTEKRAGDKVPHSSCQTDPYKTLHGIYSNHHPIYTQPR